MCRSKSLVTAMALLYPGLPLLQCHSAISLVPRRDYAVRLARDVAPPPAVFYVHVAWRCPQRCVMYTWQSPSCDVALIG